MCKELVLAILAMDSCNRRDNTGVQMPSVNTRMAMFSLSAAKPLYFGGRASIGSNCQDP